MRSAEYFSLGVFFVFECAEISSRLCFPYNSCALCFVFVFCNEKDRSCVFSQTQARLARTILFFFPAACPTRGPGVRRRGVCPCGRCRCRRPAGTVYCLLLRDPLGWCFALGPVGREVAVSPISAYFWKTCLLPVGRPSCAQQATGNTPPRQICVGTYVCTVGDIR